MVDDLSRAKHNVQIQYNNVDLYKEKESFKHKTWIIPLEDEIKGF